MKPTVALALLGCTAMAGVASAVPNSRFLCVFNEYCRTRKAGFVNCLSKFDDESNALLNTYINRAVPQRTLLGTPAVDDNVCRNPRIPVLFDQFTDELRQRPWSPERAAAMHAGQECLAEAVPACARWPELTN
ncbi:hypothetical protein SYNPS1DRAFT_28019 [Syncephalis pseudoplumigaleata]|uniref:Secreted protein n=1 Tax=Syncephalis pseudoplumigaleata TaxID=1712513 RepID=A0A4P9Z1B5_9FUNG|nr:hypothetical protein SYNPS1DRAFT_28019 [Syncephalis pseudoplumigaleata]|eukprot:RKP26283.1 hypothetical protein SYNPS1DRAFT_28019 [Syncephalis pseudoplumigaleata]